MTLTFQMVSIVNIDSGSSVALSWLPCLLAVAFALSLRTFGDAEC